MKNVTSNGFVQELESPFMDLTSFKQPTPKPVALVPNNALLKSPFKSVYELEGVEQTDEGQNGAYPELMDELYDEDFDGFLSELVYEARDLYDNKMANGTYGLQSNETMVRQSVEAHFSPLLDEIDRFMDHMIGIADAHDMENMSDREWEQMIDQYVPQLQETSPGLEHLFGGIRNAWKKAKNKLKKVATTAKRYAKTGFKYAKQRAVAFALRKIKKYAGTILKKALAWGMNKVPAKYRPIAQLLAKKMGIVKETFEPGDDRPQHYLQQELDLLTSELLLGTDEGELEMFEQEFFMEEEGFVDNSLDRLDDARQAFISKIGELQENKNANSAPAIESFAPAVMMALKLGLRFYGRDKLINKVAQPVASLIGKYIDKKYARTLSRLLVDSGLRMFNLELSPEEEVEQGNRAIAAVVEDTVRRVAQLPEHVLENEVLLENHIVQAFEESAKENFPDDVLPEEAYIKRPDLREASKHKVAWKMKVLGKGKNKKCRYKKLNKEFEIDLTPYLADEVRTFRGLSLGKVLRDQMGIVVNRRVPVKVHLYETLPGADRFHIGKNEPMISGQGRYGVETILRQIHPLTSVAAGFLLGEPALGCSLRTKCLSHGTGHSGHRYYYLEIPMARPQVYSGPSGLSRLRKTTAVNLKFNFIRNKMQLFLFLGETDAQAIAAQMRQHMQGNAARMGMLAIKAGLKIAFSRHTTEYIQVLHTKVIPGKMSGKAMEYIPTVLRNSLKAKLGEWAAPKLADHFINYKDEFIQAADADADGVTVCITMEAPTNFKVLAQIISFKKVEIPDTMFPETGLDMIITVKPGYHYA